MTTLLLTGASGVVGRALLPRLGDFEVIALVNQQELEQDGLTVLTSDVTEPCLGLDERTYRDVCRRTDVVVHSAALTDWSAPVEQLRRVNVEGTRRVLQLADDAQAPIYHVSTAFITALAPDAPLRLDPGNVIVDYVSSKVESEAVVRESGLPCTVLRPTNLIGDSRTGEIAATQIVQLVSQYVIRGKVPYCPVRPGVLLDVLPQDVVAEAIRAVIAAGDVGCEYWLTMGPEALRVEEALLLCIDFTARIGRPVPMPQLVPADALTEPPGDLPPMQRAFLGRLVEFVDGMAACGVFPTSMPELTARFALPRVDVAAAYVRGLEYWARSNGLPVQPGRRLDGD